MSNLGSDDITELAASSPKSTMLDLWRMLPESLQTVMIEAPGLPYIRVTYAFAGIPVTLTELDAVLRAYNQLAGTNFTRQDIKGVEISTEGATDNER